MPLMLGKLYDALKAANVPDEGRVRLPKKSQPTKSSRATYGYSNGWSAPSLLWCSAYFGCSGKWSTDWRRSKVGS
jgi:hypothetical protein